MSRFARWVPVVVLCLFMGCSDDDSGNDDGGAGAGGGAAAGRGGSSGGAAGRGGSGGGAAGRGGSGSGGAPAASCQACVACVTANCGTAVTMCQGNAGCTAIYDCARMCQMSVNACIAANPSGVTVWASSVSSCINQGCLAPCSYPM